MKLPDFPELTANTLQMIGEHHGFGVGTFRPLPSIGIFNAIYLLGDDQAVLVDHIRALRTDNSAMAGQPFPPNLLIGAVRAPGMLQCNPVRIGDPGNTTG